MFMSWCNEMSKEGLAAYNGTRYDRLLRNRQEILNFHESNETTSDAKCDVYTTTADERQTTDRQPTAELPSQANCRLQTTATTTRRRLKRAQTADVSAVAAFLRSYYELKAVKFTPPQLKRKKMHLLELPDDVLAEVMQRLAVPDVMSCRLVCKRLAAASQCSDVWRLRELDSYDEYAAAVLRLAPCLESLHIYGSRFVSSELSRLLFRTTRCAVRVLCFSFLSSSSSDAATARKVVRNQAALGRLVTLRLLDVDVFCSSQKVWRILLTPGLEHLYLDARPAGYNAPVYVRDAPRLPSDLRPSLKCFRCHAYGGHVRALVDFVVAGHASTLEEVSVSRSRQDVTSAAPTPPSFTLLAAMPKLRKLTCYPMPGMQAVAASTSLMALVLEVADRDSDGAVRDAAELLRRAKTVREVTLSLELESGHSLCADLVLAVGPSVESFTLSLLSRRALASGRLLRALRAPRALRRLELRWRAWQEVLSSITPCLFPDLRTLVLSMWKEDQDRIRCLNNLVGKSAVRQLLTANPLLKLVVLNLPKYCNGQITTPCWACCQCDRFAGAAEYTRVATFE
ncbi:uncharacterized protein LOC113216651 [Frankliniella occidentalis]|uniref:Uncharacterized protein LOC113216651 n=1 Tax=Frankliniella occidentalis TaxID=133901 RepID=A0A6J1THI6_FRAOC|nr:uncharacterized protein LOC113216651 [Frankliniella occidentalis]